MSRLLPQPFKKMVLVKNVPEKKRDQFAVIFISVDPNEGKTLNLKSLYALLIKILMDLFLIKHTLFVLKDEFKLVVKKVKK
ncbi:MAG: hypothetical protein CM15mP58_11390 [Burkholderiaceae bacterium]|nr:MAG: hypothetical protein CM15mP58_11390 [Burkholderiaceae bacterium]